MGNMKTVATIASLLLTSIMCIAPAKGVTLRYALILGNNVGVDINGHEPFPPLVHSEKEALKIRDKLARLANFDAGTTRTQVLTGATRRDVERAIGKLITQKKRDEKTFGPHQTIFLFYFTGHGLHGELLLEDGPLESPKIGDLFRVMAADFSIGVFDACYSGSLKSAAFNEKGLEPVPGLDLFRELPEEVLSAEGSVWYVSSGPGQVSYEDANLGGVFTHFFGEALEHADREGPGITLERIWDYTREKTVEFTTQKRRPQVPERFISKLKSSTPLYFSFPIQRSATLVLSASMEGRFLLSYANGHLTEVFQKPKDKEVKLAVYPGKARLMRYHSGNHRTIKEFTLERDRTVVLHHLPEEAPDSAVGERSVDLWEKGLGTDQLLTASTVTKGLSALIGARYGFVYATSEALLAPHNVFLSGRLDYAHLVLDLAIGYGYDTNTYKDWRYRAHALAFEASVGFGFDLKQIRLQLSGALQVSEMWQLTNDYRERRSFSLVTPLALGILFPTARRVLFELDVWGGPARCPEVSIDKTVAWHAAAGITLSVYYRFR